MQAYYHDLDGKVTIADEFTVIPSGIIILSMIVKGDEIFIPMHRVLGIQGTIGTIATLPL